MYNFKRTLQVTNCQILFKRHASKNYYTVLGLTPKANQADIKKAYYDLSMKHHPDKLEGSRSRFQEIVSAYEVLSNVKLRRLYDRGLLSPGQTPPNPADVPNEPSPAPPPAPTNENPRIFRKAHMPMAGRSRVYDFDEWTKNHYGNLRRQASGRHNEDRDRFERLKRDLDANEFETAENNARLTRFLIVSAIFMGLVWKFMGEDIDTSRIRKPPHIVPFDRSNPPDNR